MQYKGLSIEWKGHSCFKISDGKTVLYFDPFKLSEKDKADLIIVTHDHYDHCSLEDVEKIQTPETIIICDGASAQKLQGNVKVLKLGEEVEVKGIQVKAVPAYNVNKKFHPKGFGMGVVVEFAGIKLYHAGDTDRIPEMKSFGKIDIAFLPVGGTYTMNAEEAAQAAEDIRPEIAVPMHYGKIIGSRKDAELFQKLYGGKTEIL
ncbi:MAG: MBL fold metallo-hydrolase [Candidatus Diapherotrites archaeon]